MAGGPVLIDNGAVLVAGGGIPVAVELENCSLC